MDIGKFYGFTAPLSIMSNLSKGQLTKLIGLLNSNVDREILKGFLTELDTLENFLENIVQVEYVTPEDRRLGFEVKNAKKFYETGNSLKPPTLSQEEVLEKQAYLSTRPKEVARRMRIDDKIVDITQEMAQVIKYFLDKLYIIKIYKDSIKLNTTTEVVALGERLYILQNYSSNSLYWRITNMISDRKKSESLLKSTLSTLKADVNVIKSHMSMDKTMDSSNVDLSKIGISKLQSMGHISQQDVEICKILDRKGHLGRLDIEGLKSICNAYHIGCKLNIDFLNSEFGLNLNEDEYYELHERLCDVGLIGVNPYYNDFFLDMLDTAAFSRETSIEITPDKDLFRVTLELEYLLDTQLPFGGDLN